MNKTKIVLPGLLLAALLLSGCQLLSGEGTATVPATLLVLQETAEPTATETIIPTPTLVPATPTAEPPVVERIQFAPGTTSAMREGALSAGQQHNFVFSALGGQTARVELDSAGDLANFSLAAMDASPPFKSLEDPSGSWEGALPGNQEYMITVTAPEATTYSLSLAIEPLAEPSLPVIMDPGSPPSDRCIVSHPGGTAVVTVYLGPSPAFAPVALLGNWAVILNGENGWYQIQIGPGQTGWVNEREVIFDGPCDHVNEVVQLELTADGSPLRISTSLLPGQADRYTFRGEAGNRLLIYLNSSGQANFALLGVDTGQPLKRIVNEDRTWLGILPQTQEYMLTVVSGEEAADYELVLSLEPGPQAAVIYDAHTDALLGGFKDAFWVDGETAAAELLGGELYELYHLGQSLGQASGSAVLLIEGICPGHTVELSPPPANPSAIAVAGASWEVAGRLVAPVELSQIERQAMVDLLASQGITIGEAELQVQEAWGTDLDGDGLGEIIVQASRLKNDGTTPAVGAGDYFVMAVLMEIGGRLHAEPLILETYLQDNDLAYPWRYELSGALDLNGDGNLEVITAGLRWEGSSTAVYEVGTAGGAIKVLERSCAL